MAFRGATRTASLKNLATRSPAALLALAIAGTAMLGATATTASAAATTYNFINLTANTSYDWQVGTNWTVPAGSTANAAGYPGGDSTIPDDIANISYNSATALGGTETITLNNQLSNTLSQLNITSISPSLTDIVSVVLNANLSVTGAVSVVGGKSSGTLNGRANITVASGVTFNVGSLTLQGSDSGGNGNLIINGNYSATGNTTLKDDNDNIIIGSGAGNVALGNFTIARSVNNGTASSAGLHINGGNVTANSFLVATNNSSGIVQVTAGNLTISGTFIVGNLGSGSNRITQFFQSGGNVTASSTLAIASSAVQTIGTYNLSGGILSVAGITLGTGNTAAVGKFNLSGGATAYVGSNGITAGVGTANLTSSGGTIAATGNWASPSNANYSLSGGTTTFQAADASGNTFDMSISGPIAGAGAMAKAGGGNLTLAGISSYSGGTTVSAGRLIVNNASGSGTGTGAVNVTAGTLEGHGIITGSVDIGSGAHLAPGVNNVGTLVIGNLITEAGSILDFDVNAGANSLANITGSLTINGGGIDLFKEGTTSPVTTNGNYTLFNVPGGVPASVNTLQVLNQPTGITYTVGSTLTTIFVTVTGGSSASGWAVSTGGSWGTASNWLNNIIPGAGSVANFGGTITAPALVTLDGDRMVAGVIFNNANAYTLAQGSGGNLTFDNGGSTATIVSTNGSHSITAPIVLNSPTSVTISNAGDTITLSNTISGAGSLTVGGLGNLALSGASTYTGGTNITSGTVVLTAGTPLGTGNITNSASIVVAGTSSVAIAGNISGTGTLNVQGTGTLTMAGNNTYTGTTTLNAGSHLQLGSSTALGTANISFAGNAVIDLHGNALSIGALTGSAGTFDNLLASSSSSLSFTTTGTATFTSSLLSTAGSLAFIKNGSGNLTMGGATSYTGGTTINGGAILVTTANTLGSGPITIATTMGVIISDGVTLTNNIVNNIASAEFEDVNAANANVTLAGTITSGTGDQYRLGVSGSGATLTLTGANSAQAISVITQGNIIYAGSASLNVAESLPSSSTALLLGRTAGKTLNLTIQDNASITSNNGASLGSGNSSDAATINVTLNNNASFTVNGLPLNIADSNVSTAKESVSLNGSSTLKVTSFADSKSTNTAALNLNGGTIVALAADTTAAFFPAFTNVTATVQAGGAKINDGGFAITIAQPLVTGTAAGTPDGGLIKSGSGTLALNGANTYTGPTVLNAGTLAGTGSLVSAVVAGSGPHAINPGAATAGSVGTLTIGGLTTNSNTTLAFDLSSPAGTNDLLAVAGDVALNGGVLAVTSQSVTGAGSLGYYKVLTYTGMLTGSTSGIILPAPANNIVYTLDSSHDNKAIDIHRGYMGDADDNGTVDVADLQTVLQNLGSTTSSWNAGNFDGAAKIDLNDLNMVLNHLGGSVGTSAIVAEAEALVGGGTSAVPEPASLGILALGAAALMSRRRKV